MAIVYQVFSNDGAGGPVDYSTVVATVTGTTYTTAALAASGNYRFAVRAMDTTTGLVEANTQASVQIVLDSAGNNIGPIPNAPFAVMASATPGGGCLATWSYFSTGHAASPTSFLVYLTLGSSPSLTTPAATVTYQTGVAAYSCQLTGLADATAYTVSVVSEGAGGSAMSAAVSANVVGDRTPPENVDSLAAVAVP